MGKLKKEEGQALVRLAFANDVVQPGQRRTFIVLRVRLKSEQITPQVLAFIDSVEAYFPAWLGQPAYQALRRLGPLRPCRRNGQWSGQRVVVTRPTWRQLLRLELLLKTYRGVLSRLDIALDIQAANPDQMRQLILSQLMLKWRRKGVMVSVGDTTYWARRQSRRNVVVYPAAYNRITGELNPIHLELRLRGADVIRKEGIRGPKDLLMLNPQALFAKHTKWSDLGDCYVKKIIRQETAKHGHRKVRNRLMDSYVTNIPRNITTILRNNGLDRSQNVRDLGVKRKLIKVVKPPFVIPTILSEGRGDQLLGFIT